MRSFCKFYGQEYGRDIFYERSIESLRKPTQFESGGKDPDDLDLLTWNRSWRSNIHFRNLLKVSFPNSIEYADDNQDVSLLLLAMAAMYGGQPNKSLEEESKIANFVITALVRVASISLQLNTKVLYFKVVELFRNWIKINKMKRGFKLVTSF